MKKVKLISIFLLSFLFFTSNIFALSDMYSIGERDSSNNYGVNKSKIEVTDSNKNMTEKTLKVKAIDEEKPQISLNGNELIVLNLRNYVRICFCSTSTNNFYIVL